MCPAMWVWTWMYTDDRLHGGGSGRGGDRDFASFTLHSKDIFHCLWMLKIILFFATLSCGLFWPAEEKVTVRNCRVIRTCIQTAYKKMQRSSFCCKDAYSSCVGASSRRHIVNFSGLMSPIWHLLGHIFNKSAMWTLPAHPPQVCVAPITTSSMI
jgi:hypothetical protein